MAEFVGNRMAEFVGNCMAEFVKNRMAEFWGIVSYGGICDKS